VQCEIDRRLARFTFRKYERLTSEKLIQELFEKGSSFYLYPFKVLIRPHPDPSARTHQVLISVSRRSIRQAAYRNRVKRLVRECYRRNKNLLPDNPKLAIAYIYTSKEILTFAQLQERFLKTLKRIGHVEKK